MHGIPPDCFIAFDTETTGLSPAVDRVVEIAAVAFRRDGSDLGVFEEMVDPGVPIPPALSAIHGITDSDVRGRPPIEEILPRFIDFIGTAVLVAHNAPYDVSMLLVPLRGMGMITAGNRVLDTCPLARAAFPGAPNYRLGTVAARLGIAQARAHRALSDVLTCKEVFLRILERCGTSAPGDLARLSGLELSFGHGIALLDRQPAAPAGITAMLRHAVAVGCPLVIEYGGGSKGNGPRAVTPITLLARGGVAYLTAHCHVDGGLKNFRIDRITGAREATPGEL